MTTVPADILIVAARVHAMGESRGPASDGPADTIAIADGKVLGVGTRAALDALVGTQTRLLEFPTGTVVPGLVDAHMHPINSLAIARGTSLVDVSGYEELVQALERAGREQADQEWVMAWGLDPNVFEGRPVGNQVMHEVFGPDRFAYVKMFDAHSAIASAAALARAGITRPFVEDDGSSAVDDGTGRPSGLVLEFPAMDIVEAAMPSASFEDRVQQLRRLLESIAAQGITTGHVMDLKDPDALDLLRAIEADGDLPMRLRISPWCDPATTDDKARELINLQGTSGRQFRVEGIKFFIDGTVEGGTAWLDTPDADGQCRSSTWSDNDSYRSRIRLFHEHGIPTATHAIGDRGIRFAAETLAALPPTGPQHRIEHLESAGDDAIALMAEHGIAASMQPTHCTHFVHADGSDDWSRRLGPARAGRAWRTGDVRRAGVTLALGSDWPVAPYNPWDIMADARLRRPAGDPESTPVGPDQALTALEALEGYTTHAHRSIGADGGVLAAGAVADLVVVDVDPLSAAPEAVARAGVLLTLVGGRVTHSVS